MTPRFSPNARFLAYRSNESGQNAIHVRPFDPSNPDALPAGTWQISGQGGLGMVHWRQDGQELYYLDYRGGDGGVMAVPVTTTDTFTAGESRLLSPIPDTLALVGNQTAAAGRMGSISGDGQRIVFAVPLVPKRREVTVAPEILSQYAGTYGPPAFGIDLVVTRRENQLWMRTAIVPDRVAARMLAQSETSFYVKHLNIEVDFVADDQGDVTHMMLYSGGNGLRVTRQ